MNKRSAMMVAAGLILALLVAGMAVAGGFTGPDSTSAGSRPVPAPRREPKVKTITETVTVHRDAKPAGSTAPVAPVVITRSPSSPASPVDATASDDDASDDGYEDEGEYDDEYEGEDHEDEDHEADEHEADEHEEEDD